ncbi:hypothetical protein [Nocardia crassostreae]|uniref:hypothetical protein n=1 Tax=Nocardia crassostreae TaxID=53428 RepID=UPI000835EBBF|nr:hypothetical protein [Nocardia crassostreae]
MSTCSLCESALDHCHGTLIAHADGATECTDWHCDSLDRVRHVYLADCSEVAGGCECLEAEIMLDTGPQSLAG